MAQRSARRASEKPLGCNRDIFFFFFASQIYISIVIKKKKKKNTCFSSTMHFIIPSRTFDKYFGWRKTMAKIHSEYFLR